MKGTLRLCWWEYKLVQPLRKTVGRFLKKLKIELLCDPTPGHIPEKTNSKRYTHLNIHSSIYNSQDMEQLKCLSTEEWIKKLRYTYTHKEILLSHKKNEIMPLYTEMTN